MGSHPLWLAWPLLVRDPQRLWLFTHRLVPLHAQRPTYVHQPGEAESCSLAEGPVRLINVIPPPRQKAPADIKKGPDDPVPLSRQQKDPIRPPTTDTFDVRNMIP